MDPRTLPHWRRCPKVSAALPGLPTGTVSIVTAQLVLNNKSVTTGRQIQIQLGRVDTRSINGQLIDSGKVGDYNPW